MSELLLSWNDIIRLVSSVASFKLGLNTCFCRCVDSGLGVYIKLPFLFLMTWLWLLYYFYGQWEFLRWLAVWWEFVCLFFFFLHVLIVWHWSLNLWSGIASLSCKRKDLYGLCFCFDVQTDDEKNSKVSKCLMVGSWCQTWNVCYGLKSAVVL